jgi:hypothetical protein
VQPYFTNPVDEAMLVTAITMSSRAYLCPMLMRIVVPGLKLITLDNTTTVANFGGPFAPLLLALSLTIDCMYF